MAASQMKTNRPLKVTTVGDGNVGKTCLLISYTENSFPSEYVPTVFDNYHHTMKLDGESFTLTLWDTAGQEEYERLRPLSYPNTDVFLLCYAIDNRSSFDNIALKWIPELRHHCPRTPVILIGTKLDVRLKNPNGTVTTAEGKKLKQRIRAAEFIECSALTQENLKNVFDTVVRVTLRPEPAPRKLNCEIL